MELESRCLNFIEPIMLKGQALINDKHPASSLIKSYTDSLSEQLELLKTLSHLLGIHLKKLVLLQTVRIQLKLNLSCSCLSNPGCFLAQFQADCREASKQLAFHKSNLRSLLNEPSQTSSEDELNENREKAETLLTGLTDLHGNIENLANRAKQLEPFQQRKIRLVDPYNKCRCLVKLQRCQMSLEENEVCLIEDNSQKFKWKIKKTVGPQNQAVHLLPSVFFSLLGFDNDSSDLAKQ